MLLPNIHYIYSIVRLCSSATKQIWPEFGRHVALGDGL